MEAHSQTKSNSLKILKDIIGYTFVFTFVFPILPFMVLYLVRNH